MARAAGRGAGHVDWLPVVETAAGTVASTDLLTDPRVEALVVPVAPAADDHELQPRHGTADAAARYGIDLAEVAERARLSGAAGTTWTLHLPRPHRADAAALPWAGLPDRVVLAGIGDGSDRDLRRAGAAVARATRGLVDVVTSITGEGGPDDPRRVRAFVEGYLLADYRVPRTVRATDAETARREQPAQRLLLLGRHGPRTAAALDQVRHEVAATWLARDLANTPSSVKDPAWLAARASREATEAGLRVTVLEPAELARRGFGGLLAVGAGSASPPRLVVVEHRPDGGGSRGGRHVVIAGKGITFDTGGLSIKPNDAMADMKTDMAGAAVALATVVGAARAGIRHRVTAVLPLAENHVGASSYRPADVIEVFGGRTVEVANTDAEGRLVLADALAYADAELEPDLLVDVATLTGAARIALGRGHGALFGTDEALVAGLRAAGDAVGEPVWPMPLVEDYRDALRSEVADLRHVPIDSPGAGAVTAALFLREFAGGRAWAHLDIAGPARATADAHERTAGATGFGARLLLRWLAELD